MILEEDAYLEHVGVKGMKWGTRRTKWKQNQIESFRRVAEGKGSTPDKVYAHLKINPYNIGAFGLPKATAKQLDRYGKYQEKAALGKYKVSEMLNKGLLGYKIADLNVSYNKAYSNKIKDKNKAKRVVLGVLSTIGHLAPYVLYSNPGGNNDY